ncbi:MAG: PhnD/SsuA/transferrin family substrate-binding protein [Myxococcales bacterium]|nr:PhnD/SsuA/transferrin family substrate-binding protein [Myxococcales bacterium]
MGPSKRRSGAVAPRSRLHRVWLVWWALLTASCAVTDDPELVVRLTSGPKVVAGAEVGLEEAPLRFVFASVLSPERSTLPASRFASYLMGRLKRRVEIVRRKTYAELNDLLRTGSAEAGLVCAGAYTVGRAQFGLRALVTPTVDDSATYRALVITRKDSGRTRLEDLRGTVFAFSDPLSNGGYRHVAAALHALGTTPAAFFARTLFTYSHDNTIQAVRDGIADAGSVDSLIWDDLVRESPAIQDKLAIIDSSREFPSNPVVVSPHASRELAEDLARVLAGMPSDAAGKEVLKDLGISGFVKLPDAAYDPIAQSWRELGVLPAPSADAARP